MKVTNIKYEVYEDGSQLLSYLLTPSTVCLAIPLYQQMGLLKKNMKAILEEAGSDMDHVFKTLVFVADIDQFALFNETYRQYFPEDPPARSTMQVGKFNGGMTIEIEAIAVVK